MYIHVGDHDYILGLRRYVYRLWVRGSWDNNIKLIRVGDDIDQGKAEKCQFQHLGLKVLNRFNLL